MNDNIKLILFLVNSIILILILIVLFMLFLEIKKRNKNNKKNLMFLYETYSPLKDNCLILSKYELDQLINKTNALLSCSKKFKYASFLFSFLNEEMNVMKFTLNNEEDKITIDFINKENLDRFIKEIERLLKLKKDKNSFKDLKIEYKNSKKENKKSNNKIVKFRLIHLCYLLSFLIIFGFLFLEFSFKEGTCCKDIIFPTTIVVSLLPVIVSIVVMAMSFQKNELLGVIDRISLNKLRKTDQFYIDYIDFIFLTIIAFIFETIATYLDGRDITIVILDFIVVIFSFMFVYQEIPVLLENEKRILKILAKFSENVI